MIMLDGKKVTNITDRVYIVLNKPTGYVTTVSDKHAEHTVMELIKGIRTRVYPVGRLDADTAGLLILSNDGAFTEKMTHPSHQVPKTYRVVARGLIPEWAGSDLRRGILLEDGMTAPAVVEWIDYDEDNNASIVEVTIHEGRNRQVRRMFDAIGYPALALTRMQIGPVKLIGIAPGTWRKLTPTEVKDLLGAADSTPISRPASTDVLNEVIHPAGLVRIEADDDEDRDRGDERHSSSPPERKTSSVRSEEPKKPVRTPVIPARITPEMLEAAKKLAEELNAIPDEEVVFNDEPRVKEPRTSAPKIARTENVRPKPIPGSADALKKKIKPNLKKGRH